MVTNHIYINDLPNDGTVFQTQVLDWLQLYKENGINFKLLQLIHLNQLTGRKKVLKNIRTLDCYLSATIFFPSKGIFIYLNALLIILKLLKNTKNNDKTIIFSRSFIGLELKIIKIFFKNKIQFVFDARAASAEERLYSISKNNKIIKKDYELISHIYYLEYSNIANAKHIFTVSNALKNYFVKMYNVDDNKFVNYPCLSNKNKFYYDYKIRISVRKELNIRTEQLVFVYAGGLKAKWHRTDKILEFCFYLSKNSIDFKLIFLTNDDKFADEYLKQYEIGEKNVVVKSVPNDEVFKYYNAADYGLLFRENTLMNNVASPTKYAEYILCGLPVLISEGVGDYSEFTINHKVGQVIYEKEMNNLSKYNYSKLLKYEYNREIISEIGEKNLSKEAKVYEFIKYFK